MSETIVVNCKTDQYDVLIDRTTIFGNPFPVWKWGRGERKSGRRVKDG